MSRLPRSRPPPIPSPGRHLALEPTLRELRDDMDAVLDATGRRLDLADRRGSALDARTVNHEHRIAALEARNRRDRERLILLARRMRELIDAGRDRELRLRRLEGELARLHAILVPGSAQGR